MSSCADGAIQLQRQQEHQDIGLANRVPAPLVLTTGLLAKRRTRSRNSNSSSANSFSYELSPLCIPPPNSECRSPHRPIAGQSETIRHVLSVEQDLAELALLCLRLMVQRQMGPEQMAQAKAQSTKQQESGSASDPDMRSQSNIQSATSAGIQGLGSHFQSLASSAANSSAEIASSTVAFAAVSTKRDDIGSAGGGTACVSCRANELLARRLVTFADDFSRNLCGRRAAECARALPLPPTLQRSDFDSHLSRMLLNAGAMRSKVALLLLMCAEMAFRAVLLCDRVALAAVELWCQQALCSLASAFVVARGLTSLITEDHQGLVVRASWHSMAVMLTALLVGCTLIRAFRRR